MLKSGWGRGIGSGRTLGDRPGETTHWTSRAMANAMGVGRGGGEVEAPSGMVCQPGLDLGLLLAAIVVEHPWTSRPSGMSRSRRVRKRRNSWCRWRCMYWPMAVPSRMLSAANKIVVPADVVVRRHRAGAPALHRQAGLWSVQGLDLALLINREHDRSPAGRRKARPRRAAWPRNAGRG